MTERGAVRFSSLLALVVVCGLGFAADASEAKKGETRAADDSVQRGRVLFEKHNCGFCHSTDGSQRVGPTLAKIVGRTVTLSDGLQITADEAYLRESILSPGAKVVKGYPPTMPRYQGQLSDDELDALLAFLKSLE